MEWKKLSERFEAASASYAATNDIERDDDWFLLKLQEEAGEVAQAWVKLSGRGRTHGKSEAELRTALEDETADLFGHILLLAHRHGLDLPAAVKRKWRFDVNEAE